MSPLSSPSSRSRPRPRYAATVLAMAVVAAVRHNVPTVLARQACDIESGEETLEFRFFPDARSHLENGWSLECTDGDAEGATTAETIWQVPVGSLTGPDDDGGAWEGDEGEVDGGGDGDGTTTATTPTTTSAATHLVRYADCIPSTFTCTLTLYDLGGDGLSAPHAGDDLTGWYSFVYGATTIATYDGTEAFSKKTYCIGPDCEQVPQELADDAFSSSGGVEDECRDLFLTVQLDGRPQDTSFSLRCDGETVWEQQQEEEGGSSLATTAGELIELDACVYAATSCCTFTVTDADTDGMTAPFRDSGDGSSTDQYGIVYLEWGTEALLEYDGVTGEEFETLTVDFGGGCASSVPPTVEDGDEDAAEEAAAGDEDEEEDEEEQEEVEEEEKGGSDNIFGSNTTTAPPVRPDDSGESPVTGASSSQKSSNGGLSDGWTVALISVAGVVLFAGLVAALLQRKKFRSVVLLPKDQAAL